MSSSTITLVAAQRRSTLMKSEGELGDVESVDEGEVGDGPVEEGRAFCEELVARGTNEFEVATDRGGDLERRVDADAASP